MKTCAKCKQEKSLIEFHQCKSGKSKGYYSSYCKACEIIRGKEYMINNPWATARRAAKNRCENLNNNRYIHYGGRGIKFFMTLKDLKYLWFRDKAYLMKRPSIDRKDNNGNYTLKNCRYIELSENIARSSRKLIPEQVLEIREKYSPATSYAKIGKIYNIAKTSISSIIRRKTWKHI